MQQLGKTPSFFLKPLLVHPLVLTWLYLPSQACLPTGEKRGRGGPRSTSHPWASALAWLGNSSTKRRVQRREKKKKNKLGSIA
ncbi:MAG: hypothetical protein J3Q66DRAFT_81200 [Benniella sp.]|nr:MAG: hypothetical protein J3Q66DRAFT_81200 [Benniella sp.]